MQEGSRRLGAAALLVALLLLHPLAVGADVVELGNGDRITGEVKRLEGNVLVVETEYAEPFRIRAASVRSLRTEGPVLVELEGGERLKGRLEPAGEGKLRVGSAEGRGETLVAWRQVVALNPPPPEPARWEGSLTLGGVWETGNTDRFDATVAYEGRRRAEKHRFNLRFRHQHTEEDRELTARSSYGLLKYDYFFAPRLYGYLSVELLKDEFRDLNLRTVVGPGVGYQVWDEERGSLQLEVGAAYFNEDREETPDEHWLTGRLATELRWRLGESIVLSEYLVLYPSLERTGEYELRNEASIASRLVADWSLKLTSILERTSHPAPGVEKDDFTWIAGLEYAF